MAVDDHGPVMVGATWFLCWFSGAFLALRLYAKISRRQGLWWDDHILIFSWTMLLVESILTQVGQTLGFGKRTADIPPQNLPLIALGAAIAASISCFASTFSKISFGVTLLRLTSGKVRLFVWFCIVTLFLVMLPSALLTWVSCRPTAKVWNSTIEGECLDARITIGYGIFNATWCAIADFALALLPWQIVWGLQLKLKERIGVAIAMSMGLLAGMCAIIKGVYLIQLTQLDFFYNGKDVIIWTAVETATAIVGASIPILRVFFKDTISSYHGRSRAASNSNTMAKRASVPLASLHRTAGSGRTRDEPCTVTGDNASDWSILREAAEEGIVVDEEYAKGNGILRSNTITVTYEHESEEFGAGGRAKGDSRTVA